MSIKIPDEIIKRAKEWLSNKTGMRSEIRPGHPTYQFALECYMQCYQDLTEGKLDGWLVERLENDSACGIMSFYFSKKDADDYLFAQEHGYRDPSESWRIRPVKLLVLDEE